MIVAVVLNEECRSLLAVRLGERPARQQMVTQGLANEVVALPWEVLR